jgi:hypothetical protein
MRSGPWSRQGRGRLRGALRNYPAADVGMSWPACLVELERLIKTCVVGRPLRGQPAPNPRTRLSAGHHSSRSSR